MEEKRIFGKLYKVHKLNISMEDEEQKKPQVSEEPKSSVSIVDEARSIRDEIKQEREALEKANEEKKKLQAEELLSGSAGGHIEAVQVSPEDAKKVGAKEFFKGTQLETAIDKL